MIDCSLIQDELVAFLKGECHAPLHAEIESHILGCADCARVAQEWRVLFALVRRVPVIEPSTGLCDRLTTLEDRADALPGSTSARLKALAEHHGDCERFAEDLVSFAAQKWRPADDAPFFSHVRDCEQCRLELDRLDGFFESLASWPAIEASDRILRGLERAIPELARPSRRSGAVQAYLARHRRSPRQRLAAAWRFLSGGESAPYLAGAVLAHGFLLFVFSMMYRPPIPARPPLAVIWTEGEWEFAEPLTATVTSEAPGSWRSKLSEREWSEQTDLGAASVEDWASSPPLLGEEDRVFGAADDGAAIRGWNPALTGASRARVLSPPRSIVGVKLSRWQRARDTEKSLLATRRAVSSAELRRELLQSRLNDNRSLVERQERLVRAGLSTLAVRQRDDGAWSSGDGRHDLETTALVMLAFLAEGYDSAQATEAAAPGAQVGSATVAKESARYGAGLRRAADYLLLQQSPATGLFRDSRGPGSMTAHAIATVALLEDFLMVAKRDVSTAKALRDAIRAIIAQQHDIDGGMAETLGGEQTVEATFWGATALMLARDHPVLAREVDEDVLRGAARSVLLRTEPDSRRIRQRRLDEHGSLLATAQGLLLAERLARFGVDEVRALLSGYRRTLVAAPPAPATRVAAPENAFSYAYAAYGLGALASSPRHEDFVPWYAATLDQLEALHQEGVWTASAGDGRELARDAHQAAALAILALQAPYRM